MRQILSKIKPKDIHQKASVAGAMIHASIWDDIGYQLNKVSREKGSMGLITMDDMLKALNQTMWLNSFLKQTDGSAEVLLSGLDELYRILEQQSESKINGYVTDKDYGYTEACIISADFIKTIAHANLAINKYRENKKNIETIEHKLESNSDYHQQEEELSNQDTQIIQNMADELFCKSLLDDIQKNRHLRLVDVAHILSPAEDLDNKYVSIGTMNRRFASNILSERTANAMLESKHYKPNRARIDSFINYLSNVIDDKIESKPQDINTDELLDLYDARKAIHRALLILSSEPHERGM